jgi:hypothetical protein
MKIGAWGDGSSREFLYTLDTGPGPIHLLLDLYSTHRAEPIKNKATELGIALCSIPPGATGLLQPVDRKTSGLVKLRRKDYCRKDAGRIHCRKKSKKKQQWIC